MGICWTFPTGSHKANPEPDSDPVPGTNDHLLPGDVFDFGDDSWVTVVSTSVTTWVSQVSSSFPSLWAHKAAEDDQFSDASLLIGGIASTSNLSVFTLAQMKAATNNFRSDMVVGKGGFGKVYKGWVKDKVSSKRIKKSPIAVKKLDSKSRQGRREWRAEVRILGRLSHPNLVKLLGFCDENEEFLLVYEFVRNGSLNYHLFGRGSIQPLTWDMRLKVVLGMARGLAYMHTLEPPIIHRDLKSSNVLLDRSFNAKISDFGLAFLGPLTTGSHVSSSLVGTQGYTDPQFLATGNLYVKSDVYSFGVVLVETLTGLRAIDKKRPDGQRVLVDWVKPFLSNRSKLKRIMDYRLEGKYSSKEALQIAQIAIKCLQFEPTFRPSMTEIAETLEQIEACKHRTVRT